MIHNNNTIISHTEPGVFPKEVWERISKEYLANVAPQITGAMMNVLEHESKMLSPDEIIEAIHITGLAPQPSARYLKKVLENMSWEKFWNE